MQGEQIYEWDEGADGYRDLTAAAVAFAAGKAPAPMVTAESRAALRSVFAGYGEASPLLRKPERKHLSHKCVCTCEQRRRRRA